MKCIYLRIKYCILIKLFFIYRNNSFSVTHGNEDVKKFSSVHWKDMKKLRNQSVQYQWLMEYCDNTQLRLLLELFQNSSNKECAIYEKTYHYKRNYGEKTWMAEWQGIKKGMENYIENNSRYNADCCCSHQC